MTIAEWHGKLRPYEAMEDLLTSDVFQGLKYCPPELVIKILGKGVSFVDQKNFFCSHGVPKSVRYFFWPRSLIRLEPDLIIVLDLDTNERIVINIEAKYKSGKHNVNLTDNSQEIGKEEFSRVSGDQLLDQYMAIKKNQYKGDLGELIKSGKRKYLFYLTGHYVSPVEDINETKGSFEKAGLNEEMDKLFWLSWNSIWDVLNQNKIKYGFPFEEIIADLLNLLNRKNLKPLNLWKWNRVKPISKAVWFWKQKFFKIPLVGEGLNRPIFFKETKVRGSK